METGITVVGALLAGFLITLIYMAAVLALLDYISKQIKNDKK